MKIHVRVEFTYGIRNILGFSKYFTFPFIPFYGMVIEDRLFNKDGKTIGHYLFRIDQDIYIESAIKYNPEEDKFAITTIHHWDRMEWMPRTSGYVDQLIDKLSNSGWEFHSTDLDNFKKVMQEDINCVNQVSDKSSFNYCRV